MPSTIQGAWRTKQVTTYGRRKRNVVPVFDLEDFKPASTPQRPSKAPASETPSNASPPRLKPKAAKVSKLGSSRYIPSPIKVSPKRLKSNEERPVRKRVSSRNVPATPGRVPLGVKTASNASLLDKEFIPKKDVASISKTPAKISSTLNLFKRQVSVAIDSRTPRPTLKRVGHGKGLPPSPPQVKAPQVIEIIDLDSEGETVNVEKRLRKPMYKSSARMKRVILSDDSGEDDHDSDDMDSFDEKQKNMPWNAVLRDATNPSSRRAAAIGRRPTRPRLPDTSAMRNVPKPNSKTNHKASTPGSASITPSDSPVSSLHSRTSVISLYTTSSSQCASLSTTSTSAATEDSQPSLYEAVVSDILSSAPESVNETYTATRDPRVLFPFAGSVRRKKVLSDWLEANYFIPKSPDSIAISMGSSQGSIAGDGGVLPSLTASAALQNESGPRMVAEKNRKSNPTSLHVDSSSRTRKSSDVISISSSDRDYFPRRGVKVPLSTARSQKKGVEVVDLTADTDDEIGRHMNLLALDDITNQDARDQLGRTIDTLSYPAKSALETAQTPSASVTAFQSLLDLSKQEMAYEFASFVDTFPWDTEIHGPHVGDGAEDSPLVFRKVGEASFSEVFQVGEVVLKIIPIDNPRDDSSLKPESDTPWPSVSDPADVLREIQATQIMGEVHTGFIKLLRTFMVKGAYPRALLDEWDAYDERKGSESISPKVFPDFQHYVVILLPPGGSDLEAQDFAKAQRKKRNAWRLCASIFWQVCRALAVAEEAVSFEHRDLHWGQILIDGVAPGSASKGKQREIGQSRLVPMDCPSHGVKATIIDFGLSRMNPPIPKSRARRSTVSKADTQYTLFEEVIFQGEGDYQFEIYRMMRRHNGDDWNAFSPLSNVMWLHYLLVQLLNGFNLKQPATLKQSSSIGYGERVCWEVLVRAEELLKKELSHLVDGAPKRRTKSKAGAQPLFSCAHDVLRWGQEQGWIS